MKSDTLAQLLASLGASRSFSRPHVSDDNPFSEAQFKTMKYQPDYPGHFESEVEARDWLSSFFAWHNDDHHHSGLALFTPADVFHGRVEAVADVRQAALDSAYHAHPERFPHGPPRVPRPPVEVHINPLTNDAVVVGEGDDRPAQISQELVLEASATPPRADPLADQEQVPTERARLGLEPTRRPDVRERAAVSRRVTRDHPNPS